MINSKDIPTRAHLQCISITFYLFYFNKKTKLFNSNLDYIQKHIYFNYIYYSVTFITFDVLKVKLLPQHQKKMS
jgi:hypothetical protein